MLEGVDLLTELLLCPAFGDADGEAVGELIACGRSETRLPKAVRKPESSLFVTLSLEAVDATRAGVWAIECGTGVGIGSESALTGAGGLWLRGTDGEVTLVATAAM